MRCGQANLVTSPPSVSSACLASNAALNLHRNLQGSLPYRHAQKAHSARVSPTTPVMRSGSALNASATDTELAAVSGAAAGKAYL